MNISHFSEFGNRWNAESQYLHSLEDLSGNLVYTNSLVSFEVMNSGVYFVTKDTRNLFFRCADGATVVKSQVSITIFCWSFHTSNISLMSVTVSLLESASTHVFDLNWRVINHSSSGMSLVSNLSECICRSSGISLMTALLFLRQAACTAVFLGLSCLMLTPLALRDLR